MGFIEGKNFKNLKLKELRRATRDYKALIALMGWTFEDTPLKVLRIVEVLRGGQQMKDNEINAVRMLVVEHDPIVTLPPVEPGLWIYVKNSSEDQVRVVACEGDKLEPLKLEPKTAANFVGAPKYQDPDRPYSRRWLVGHIMKA